MSSQLLKIWNGRDVGSTGTLFVCAHSKAHACRLLAKAHNLSEDHASRFKAELNGYFNADCWGVEMDGIEPEVGVWRATGFSDKPVKIA